MRATVISLLLGLLLLTACASGQDPWDTEGWRNNMLDYETDFWEPIEKPQPAPCAPAARPVPQGMPQPAPVWSTPAPGGTPPQPPPPSGPGAYVPVQPAPRRGSTVPPPPPPPYALPR